MGIGLPILQELIALKRSHALVHMRRVVEIGAQQLSNSFLRSMTELEEACRLFGQPNVPRFCAPLDGGHAGLTELQSATAPSSRAFWEALGWEYSAIDYDGHRHSRALDLNRDPAPEDWRGVFDLVVNAGTTEHVANQDNAWRVMHDLVRVGGVMIHDVPAGGMMTHGMVVYTMRWFWALCRVNRYEVLRLEMIPGGPMPMDPGVLETCRRYGRGFDGRFCGEMIRDWAILASLRKAEHGAFVTPLDLEA